MIEIFIRVLPFFALIGLGYGAGRTGFFTQDATAWLTKFVFYFALSAMIFRFAATLPLEQVFNPRLIAGYLWGTAFVYGIATIAGFLRKLDVPTTAVEAQCAAIGNVGFLGLPMFAVLFGQEAIGIVMMVLATDLIVFSGLIVILINGGRGEPISLHLLKTIALGLLRNPMIVSILLGLTWSALSLPIPGPFDDFLIILGGAATPGALFAIGASLARKSGERVQIAGWLSFCKLALHPIFVAIGVLFLFPIDTFSATVVISAAALPVAGNVFMLAQHYNIAAQRVSAAILLSTVISILSVPAIIALLSSS
ncbi:MAG: AEC family transporter [Rhodobacteraceae bacterium]|nr:AEC family transporter [Paracoccaceae bacterium]